MAAFKQKTPHSTSRTRQPSPAVSNAVIFTQFIHRVTCNKHCWCLCGVTSRFKPKKSLNQKKPTFADFCSSQFEFNIIFWVSKGNVFVFFMFIVTLLLITAGNFRSSSNTDGCHCCSGTKIDELEKKRKVDRSENVLLLPSIYVSLQLAGGATQAEVICQKVLTHGALQTQMSTAERLKTEA